MSTTPSQFETWLEVEVSQKYIFSLQFLILISHHIFLAFYSSPLSLFTWQWNKLCCHLKYHHIGKILWCHIFKQLLFCFILLPFVHLLVPKKNKTCDINKQKLFIQVFLLKFLFSWSRIFLSYSQTCSNDHPYKMITHLRQPVLSPPKQIPIQSLWTAV